MRSPRSTRRSLAAVRVSFAALVALAPLVTAACGGPSGPPKTADGPGAPAPSSTASDLADAAPPPSTTTTLTLSDAGDLQGSRLETKSTATAATGAPDGGKAAGGGGGKEPGRSVEDIMAIVQAHRDEARACYDAARKTNTTIEGDLDVKWTIDPKGHISDIGVDEFKSQIHDLTVGNCVIGVIKKITFAPSAKGLETRIHYPFNFHPRNPTTPTPPPNN